MADDAQEARAPREGLDTYPAVRARVRLDLAPKPSETRILKDLSKGTRTEAVGEPRVSGRWLEQAIGKEGRAFVRA